MDLYYYCSYDGSPVGFKIGKLDSTDSENTIQELSDENIEPFIRRCFESGLVRNAFGKIPSKTSNKKYFALKKKLKTQKDDSKYYMNIAFVENEWDEFKHLMKECDIETSVLEEKLAKAVADSIKQQKDNDFGFKVDTQKLSDLISCWNAKICNGNEKRIQEVMKNDAFFATLSTEKPDVETLKTELGLDIDKDEKTTEIKEIAPKLFKFIKKKSTNVKENVKKKVERMKKITANVELVITILLVIAAIVGIIVWIVNVSNNQASTTA